MVRGTLFTVQKALPRLNDRGSIIRTERQEYPGERAEPGAGRHIGFQRLDKATKEMFESLIPRERWIVQRKLRRPRCLLLQTSRAT